MSLTLRRIAAVTAIAMSAAIMLAPHAQAATAPVTTHPVVNIMAPDHKTVVGQAVYTFNYRNATVLAVINHPVANTDYNVKIVVLHDGFRSFDSVTACTIHATSTNRAGCIGTVRAPTRHHNDTTVIALSYGSPMKWAGWSAAI